MTPISAREARTILIQAPTKVPEKVMIYTGVEYLDIELTQRNFSTKIKLPDGDLTLALLPDKLASGDQMPAEAPRFTIPASWGRCLLVFFADPANKVIPLRVIAVNASPDHFPIGHTLLYNFSNVRIHGDFGGQMVSLLPGKRCFIKPPISQVGAYPVMIECVFPNDKKVSTVFRSNWRHEPDARQLLFVTPSAGHKIPRVWGVLDR
jgi:hypothetical protein